MRTAQTGGRGPAPRGYSHMDPGRSSAIFPLGPSGTGPVVSPPRPQGPGGSSRGHLRNTEPQELFLWLPFHPALPNFPSPTKPPRTPRVIQASARPGFVLVLPLPRGVTAIKSSLQHFGVVGQHLGPPRARTRPLAAVSPPFVPSKPAGELFFGDFTDKTG